MNELLIDEGRDVKAWRYLYQKKGASFWRYGIVAFNSLAGRNRLIARWNKRGRSSGIIWRADECYPTDVDYPKDHNASE